MDEEGMARKLWIKYQKDSVVAMYTPFLVCLASGELEIDVFLNCISQDVHFVKAFSQAYSPFVLFNLSFLLFASLDNLGFLRVSICGFFRYERAEDCADDDEDKAAIRKMRKLMEEALRMRDDAVQVRS